MIKISKNEQIIFFLAIFIFGIVFVFYFFGQTKPTDDVMEVRTGVRRTATPAIKESLQINLDLFKSEKFNNLKSEVAPTVIFSAGKRNPFEPSK